MSTTLCKCGNPSLGTELKTFYKRKDGTIAEYVKTEKRCQACITASKKVQELKKDDVFVNNAY